MISTSDLYPNVLKNLGKNKACVTEVLFFDKISDKQIKELSSLGVKVTSFDVPLNHNQILDRPKLTLNHEISYAFTSGTTGIPKGVVCTHLMAATQVLAMKNHFEVISTDTHISFLPIAHVFERFVMWCVIEAGAQARYAKYPTP